jgi:transcriptional regulator with XRE-family HTH domain
MMNLEQIKLALADRNMQKVADAVDVTRAHIQQIRKGTGKPSADLLQKLSDYFERPVK